MMSGDSFRTRAIEWLSARFPADKMSVRSMLAKKEVPKHRMTWAYYLGGLTLFFFLVQLITGLFLLFYYEPTVSDAHASVEYITNEVAGGALIRNIHTWSSSLMIATLLVHLLTTFAMKAFAKPREVTWIVGVLLLLITFGFGFTGYLLPWNQIAVNATKVGLQSIEGIGAYMPAGLADLPTQLRETIQGEATVGQATLSRFFALHVVVLPLLAFAAMGLHLFSVQLHGMSLGVDNPTNETERFFPFFVFKDFTTWGIAFLILFILATTIPFEAFFSYPLFEPYHSLGSTPDGIKPEWYFYFVYYPLEILPYWMILIGSGLAMAVLFFAPWIFRNTSKKSLRIIASVAALYLLVITLFGEEIHHMLVG